MENKTNFYCQASDDLKDILISYLSPLKIKFSFGNSELYLSETFNQNGFLPLFLFDKQPIVNKYIESLNIKNKDKFYTIINNYKSTYQNLLGIVFKIENNLIYEVFYEDKKEYNNLLLILAKSILSQKDFINQNGTIALDSLYDKFILYFNNLPNINIDNNILEKNELTNNKN